MLVIAQKEVALICEKKCCPIGTFIGLIGHINYLKMFLKNSVVIAAVL